ncbi:MAG TPA: class I SAM-dependent methyltransferase [Candidatus Dormibacteraeota bacterium]|nr:class I SAM-dependent methyltransferase [Candidatus Dormibacteraeota bacterium]
MGLVEAVARIPAFLGSLVGEDLQRSITREYHKALQSGWHHFPAFVSLPNPCGLGLPERVVELLLARLSYAPGSRVLDVGYANSMICHRDLIRSLPAPRHLTGIDMADPVFDAGELYSETVRGDICDTEFPDGVFDLVWCISSLEHIGMDNSGYAGASFAGAPTAERALSEMMRITRPGGSLLVTVPFGAYENHGWFRNFDEETLEKLLEPVRLQATIHELYFGHSHVAGWSRADAHELAGTGYLDQGNAGAAGLAALLIEKDSSGWQ